MQRTNNFKKFTYVFFVILIILIIFLPFAVLLGNILEFKTALSSSQIFWITHWYEPLLVVSFLFLVFRHFKQRNTINGLPQLLALVLVVFGIISAVFISPSIGRGLEGFRFTILPIVFFILANNFDPETKKKILPSLTTYYLLLTTFVALWAILERFLPVKYWSNWGLVDPNLVFGWGWHGAGGFLQSASFLGGPNQLGSYLLPALFISVYSIRITDNGKAASKTVYCLLSTVILLAILLTLSRSAILGLIIGLAVYFFYFNSKKILTYTVSSFFIVAIFLIWLFGSNTSLKNIITHDGQTGHATAFAETLTEIKSRVIEKPSELIIGSGLGSAGPLVIKYGNGFISESWYLQILLEIGIVGITLWIWLIISLLKELLKKKENGLFLGLLAVSFAAIFLHTWADNPALSYSLFTLLGIATFKDSQKKS